MKETKTNPRGDVATNETNATNTTPPTANTTPAPLFKHLRAAVIKDGNETKTARAFFIKYGYFKKWDEESKNDVIKRGDQDQGIKEYLTAAKYSDYKSGKISRARAIEIATARAYRETDKQTARKLDRITTAENAPELDCVNISVEWARSRVWGYNPTATAQAYSKRKNGYTERDEATGSASGCGYDKQSAAISESLNKIPAILKILYATEEKRLKGRESRKQSRRDFIGYGAGYGVLPYFEGGCGVSVYNKIFSACGFVFKCTASGKTFDAYTITKEAQQ